MRSPIFFVSFSILFSIGLVYAVSYLPAQLSAQEVEEDVTRKTSAKEIPLTGVFYFGKKTDKISNSDLQNLQLIAEHLVKNPNSQIYIRAHSWDGGTEKEEIELSERRSKEVERFLTIHGVSETQIHRLFYGNFRPLNHGLTTKDQEIQRRVEYQLIN
ncbi:OmpA family protein [Leptospira ognonensis]|uniref:OmpA family protein n=1 Tax=Leptospira ognonensis TaxID=2484945 RepID=UPI0014383EAC|nr:OmpA family protein [Leptospira ognonensis]